jgi:Flp pilus assembly protein TadD
MVAGPDDAVPGSLPAPDVAFQSALSLRRQGDSERADALCAELLRVDPRDYHAYHLRGLIALEQGEMQRGMELIGRSLAINPHQPMAFSNVGNALRPVSRIARSPASMPPSS